MFDINSITFEEIPDQIVWIGNKVAEYTASYELLKDKDNVMLATLGQRLRGEGKISMTERENYALTLPEYTKHIEAKAIARTEMLKNKAYMQALEAKFDYLRTIAANSRNQRY